MENQVQQNVRTSFLNLKNAVGSKGQAYIACTCFVKPLNVTPVVETPAGHQVLHFAGVLHGCADYIAKFTGIQPTSQQDGSVWVSVSVWDKMIERFQRYLQNHPNGVVLITGALQMKERAGKDNRVFQNVSISIDGFAHARDAKPSPSQPTPQAAPVPISASAAPVVQQGAASGSPQPTQAPNTPAPSRPAENTNDGFVNIPEDEILPY